MERRPYPENRKVGPVARRPQVPLNLQRLVADRVAVRKGREQLVDLSRPSGAGRGAHATRPWRAVSSRAMYLASMTGQA